MLPGRLAAGAVSLQFCGLWESAQSEQIERELLIAAAATHQVAGF